MSSTWSTCISTGWVGPPDPSDLGATHEALLALKVSGSVQLPYDGGLGLRSRSVDGTPSRIA